LVQEGIRPQVDRAAISHLLHHSVVPVPSTCLTGLYVLSVGDRASLIATDSGIELSFVNDFPYLEQRSSGRSAPETHILLERLTHAVQDVGRGGDSIALLTNERRKRLRTAGSGPRRSRPARFGLHHIQAARGEAIRKRYSCRLLRSSGIEAPRRAMSYGSTCPANRA
jgi:hypothetical protein